MALALLLFVVHGGEVLLNPVFPIIVSLWIFGAVFVLAGTRRLDRYVASKEDAERSSRSSEEKFRTMANFAYDWEYWIGSDLRMLYTSPSCERISGYRAEEFVSDPDLMARIVHPDDGPAYRSHICRHFPEGGTYREEQETEFRIVSRDGEVRWILHACRPVFDRDGVFLGRRVTNRDITDRKELELQLRHALRVEGIGRLAGEVAHDFNNTLTAILGYGYMLKKVLRESDPAGPLVEHILDEVRNAETLTKGILAFSRKEVVHRGLVDVNETVKRMGTLLKRILQRDIMVRTILAPGEIPILADGARIDQVLMNLAMNARDAMPDGGILTIRTEIVDVDEEIAKVFGVERAGVYALLTCTDTGTGIDPKIVGKIFEPFFTTKDAENGTGLGLSIVYGTVRQHGGTVTVSSAVGTGTTFQVYLPLAGSESASAHGAPALATGETACRS